MLQYPGFDPIAFEIGPVKVHWYGIMYLIGFAGAWWLARYRASRPGSTWKASDVDDFVFYGMLGAIVGGRVGYVLFYGLEYWAKDIWYPVKIWEGGMSFHGGMLGVIAAMAIFGWRRHRSIADVFDFSVALPGIGLFTGRLGNFINGELPGRPTDLPWGMWFPQHDPTQLARHPSQLYQFALEGVALFAILWLYSRKPRPVGAISGAFLVGYGAFRFIAEFARQPDDFLGLLQLGLSMGQWLSLPMILAGVAMMVWAHKRAT